MKRQQLNAERQVARVWREILDTNIHEQAIPSQKSHETITQDVYARIRRRRGLAPRAVLERVLTLVFDPSVQAEPP